VVIDNEIRLTNPDPALTAALGVSVHAIDIDGADVYVARNLITRCGRGCLDCSRSRAA
jgi:hypothetical protein